MLEKKPFEKISVKELLEESGIPKTTFYRHYKDLFTIFDKVISRDLPAIEIAFIKNPLQDRKEHNKKPPETGGISFFSSSIRYLHPDSARRTKDPYSCPRTGTTLRWKSSAAG